MVDSGHPTDEERETLHYITLHIREGVKNIFFKRGVTLSPFGTTNSAKGDICCLNRVPK